MRNIYYHIVSSITMYRLVMGIILIVLVSVDQYTIFKWLLPVSFFTDIVDGYLARKYKVTSRTGSIKDSIADDITVAAAFIAAIVYRWPFVKQQAGILLILGALYLTQNFLAFKRYGKMTSFHTLLAKLAAVLQGCFFILLFLLRDPVYSLFYAAVIVTGAGLCEEILLVILLPRWQANVHGLYWALKNKNV